ncbi:hypothetical protein SAMN02745248_00580 [Hathewaya proteolytica DSM 3090]|uniref:Phage tail protein n=1 Tax=Hathewaya proteolytica DSM 3090 TaxID=1121331 RepID=A0A1M6L122_9CLOT|nr:hypothetical protein [Hathewaya proteolytica]SHJ64822.1 hypothetical protein SAMN02745248_00580 [Hathewaya proteolytica DSM 3090]
MAVSNDEVILGSGKLYLMAYTTGEMPTDLLLEVPTNSVGRIKGGASLEYKPTEYAVEDDDGQVVKRFITKEEVTFKSGILTWALENIEKLTPAKISTTEKEKILKIGGSKSLVNYALRFVHTKDNGKKLRITMVATAGNGFVLKFEGAKETTIDAEFKAVSQATGTLVEIKEEL